MVMTSNNIRKRLRELGDKKHAAVSQKFFKTGPGEYGEGDIFLGIKVPVLRNLAKGYKDLSFEEIKTVLRSEYHEERLLALLIMVGQFAKGDLKRKQRIYKLYLENTVFINNWDLVDVSAYKIVGPFLMNRSRAPLYDLARSETLWERRIAIMSTFHFIKNNDFNDALNIAAKLLSDQEDLIHKAVGWMLREIGKRHLPTEEAFLKKHYKMMPRTMLRYAIEKFPESRRKSYLKGTY
jgi:3-methyladenine DNA glycosylase AlkD